jgi:L-asparaginase II
LVAKEGAEAVHAVGLPDGIGIAVKVADGGDRARLPITIGILGMLGVDRTRLANLTCPATLGGGRPVGGLRVAETLFDNFRTSSIESAL